MSVHNIHPILFFLFQLYYTASADSILGYSLHIIVPSLVFSVCLLLSFYVMFFMFDAIHVGWYLL